MRFQGKKSSTIQIRIAAATAYEYLSVKLNSSFEEFGENKLSIITFNYDCSLEHYLLNSLINSHEKTRDECAKALTQIPIVHVYCQLGERPYCG